MRVEHNLKVNGWKLVSVEVDYDRCTVVGVYEDEEWMPKNGEFATLECEFGKIISIIGNGYDEYGNIHSHAFTGTGGSLYINHTFGFRSSDGDTIRQSTTEEKELLLSKLAEQGKVWNSEKKCVEDFYIPKNGEFCFSSYSDDGGSSWIHIVKDASDRSAGYDVIENHAILMIKSNVESSSSLPRLMLENAMQSADLELLRPATNEEKAVLLSELAKQGLAWDFTLNKVINLP